MGQSSYYWMLSIQVLLFWETITSPFLLTKLPIYYRHLETQIGWTTRYCNESIPLSGCAVCIGVHGVFVCTWYMHGFIYKYVSVFLLCICVIIFIYKYVSALTIVVPWTMNVGFMPPYTLSPPPCCSFPLPYVPHLSADCFWNKEWRCSIWEHDGSWYRGSPSSHENRETYAPKPLWMASQLPPPYLNCFYFSRVLL